MIFNLQVHKFNLIFFTNKIEVGQTNFIQFFNVLII